VTLACGRPPFQGIGFPESGWQGEGTPQQWAYDPYYWAIATLASQYVYGYDPYSQHEANYGFDQYNEQNQDTSNQSDYWNLYPDPGPGEEIGYGDSWT
jgi:hypothetical protein